MNSSSTKKSTAASKWFRVVMLSLFIALITLGFIVGLKIEMQGYGAYLYLLVSAASVIYILSTIIFVVLSVRNKSGEVYHR